MSYNYKDFDDHFPDTSFGNQDFVDHHVSETDQDFVHHHVSGTSFGDQEFFDHYHHVSGTSFGDQVLLIMSLRHHL